MKSLLDKITRAGSTIFGTDENLRDNTDKVRGASPLPVEVNNLKEEELILLQEYRNNMSAANYLDEPDRVLGKIPFWNIIDLFLRKYIPKGYGTYASALILIIASIASGFGYPLPIIEIPESLSGVSGMIGMSIWFIRRAIGDK